MASAPASATTGTRGGAERPTRRTAATYTRIAAGGPTPFAAFAVERQVTDRQFLLVESQQRTATVTPAVLADSSQSWAQSTATIGWRSQFLAGRRSPYIGVDVGASWYQGTAMLRVAPAIGLVTPLSLGTAVDVGVRPLTHEGGRLIGPAAYLGLRWRFRSLSEVPDPE